MAWSKVSGKVYKDRQTETKVKRTGGVKKGNKEAHGSKQDKVVVLISVQMCSEFQCTGSTTVLLTASEKSSMAPASKNLI